MRNSEYIISSQHFFRQLLGLEKGKANIRFLQEEYKVPLPAPRYCASLFDMSNVLYFTFLLTLCYTIDPCINEECNRRTKANYLCYGLALSLYNELTTLSLEESSVLMEDHFLQLLFEDMQTSYLLTKELRMRKEVLYYLMNEGMLAHHEITFYNMEEQVFASIYKKEKYTLCKHMEYEQEAIICGPKGSGKHTLVKCYANEVKRNILYINMLLWICKNEEERNDHKKTIIFYTLLQTCDIVLEYADQVHPSFITQWRELAKAYNLRIIILCEDCQHEHSFIALPYYLSKEDTNRMALKYLDEPWHFPLYHITCQDIVYIAELMKNGLQITEAISLCLHEETATSFCKVLHKDVYLSDWLGDEEIKEQLLHLIFMLKNPLSSYSSHHSNTILFHGPSGTGKTMAASMIGKEAGLPVWQIKLSNILDKYIGESEKHLEQVFDEAEKKNCILLFDEADVLFGKRTSISSSNDRYANSSTAYLLQKLEHYEGIVILTSNYIQNFDDAFLRRLRFVIRFPMAQEEIREDKWKASLQKLSLAFLPPWKELGCLHGLSLAQIENICENTRYYALEEDASQIIPIYLLKAIQQEYQKRQDQIPRNIETLLKEMS